METIDQRMSRLFVRPEDFTEMRTQIESLRYTLLSAIQDIAVMHELMQRTGAWNPALYRELRTKRMIDDHSSAGCDPFGGHSAYRYTLDEADFLRKQFRATPAEVAAFERKAQEVACYT